MNPKTPPEWFRKLKKTNTKAPSSLMLMITCNFEWFPLGCGRKHRGKHFLSFHGHPLNFAGRKVPSPPERRHIQHFLKTKNLTHRFVPSRLQLIEYTSDRNMVEINPLNRNIADSNRSDQPLLIEMRMVRSREDQIGTIRFAVTHFVGFPEMRIRANQNYYHRIW